jgi:hypothetical protein
MGDFRLAKQHLIGTDASNQRCAAAVFPAGCGARAGGGPRMIMEDLMLN